MNRQACTAAIALALLLALASDGRAQIGRVAGTVTDEDGRPVKGATIVAENRDQSPSTMTSTTDGKGRFSILGIRRGVWSFTIQAPGFDKATTRLDIVTTRPNPPLNVQIVRGTSPAPPGPLAGIDAAQIQRRLDTAASLAASGDHRGALAAYSELLTRVPALTAIYLQIGELHERMNDTGAALAAYKRLAELEPENTRASAAIERLGRR